MSVGRITIRPTELFYFAAVPMFVGATAMFFMVAHYGKRLTGFSRRGG